ncbi:MAG: hypothetical protein LR015_08080, partial [Verrucomicrobia bacterium]|nr:hypothetical protein [Verrucomicrobiota bacterium]
MFYPNLSGQSEQEPMSLVWMQQFAAITTELNRSDAVQLQQFALQLAGLLERNELNPAESYRALQILLRINELEAGLFGGPVSSAEVWGELFSGDSRRRNLMNSTQLAFLARRLVVLEGDAGIFPEELTQGMRQFLRRFEMQQSLLQAYYQGNWRTDNGSERGRILMLAGRQFVDESYINIINETPRSGTILMHMSERSIARWLSPLWEHLPEETQLWLRITSPWSNCVFDSSAEGVGSIASIDMPEPFSRWTLELGFVDDNFLTRTTRQQTAFTIYAGVALVLL